MPQSSNIASTACGSKCGLKEKIDTCLLVYSASRLFKVTKTNLHFKHSLMKHLTLQKTIYFNVMWLLKFSMQTSVGLSTAQFKHPASKTIVLNLFQKVLRRFILLETKKDFHLTFLNLKKLKNKPNKRNLGFGANHLDLFPKIRIKPLKLQVASSILRG